MAGGARPAAAAAAAAVVAGRRRRMIAGKTIREEIDAGSGQSRSGVPPLLLWCVRLTGRRGQTEAMRSADADRLKPELQTFTSISKTSS